MTDLRTAAQQALEALSCIEYEICGITDGPSKDSTETAITALRAALAEDALERMSEDERRLGIQMQSVQGPVAWRITDGEGDWNYCTELPHEWSIQWSARYGRKYEPLYTAPPQRKPLTEEEIKRIDDSTHFHESPDWSLRFARAVERAHGIGDNT